jgi:hypothetical protein
MKHGGATVEDNLALACWRCNRHKGSDVASFDPQTGVLTPLFNPRSQHWSQHFRLEDETLIGLSAEGRTTVRLLQLNAADRLSERRQLIERRLFPIPDTDRA